MNKQNLLAVTFHKKIRFAYLSFLWKNYYDVAETCEFAAIGLFEVVLEVDVRVVLTVSFLHPRAAIKFIVTTSVNYFL